MGSLSWWRLGPLAFLVDMLRYTLFAAAALFCVFICLNRLIDAPFLYDDHYVIEKEQARQSAVESVQVPDLTQVFGPRLSFWEQPRPLRYLSIRLDQVLFGGSPQSMHFVNILLHLLCGVLFFILLKSSGVNDGWAFASVMLFLVNPVAVESVGVVSHRKELLSTLFLLSGLIFAIKKPERVSLLALICWFLACAGKETAVVFPLLAGVLLLRGHISADTPPDMRHVWGRFAAVIATYLVMSVVFAVLFYLQIHHGMDTVGQDPGQLVDRAGHFVAGTDFSIGASAATRAFPRYLGLLFWPFAHSVDPPFRMIETGITLSLAVSALSVAAAIVLGVIMFRVKSGMLIPYLWILMALSPYLFPPLLQAGATEVLADRYAYMASPGAAWLLVELVKRVLPGRWPVAAVAAVFSLFAVCTVRLCHAYADEESFWRYSSERNPESFMAAHNHAMALWKEKEDFAGAVDEYERMLQINPGFGAGYISYSDLHNSCNDPMSAEEILDRGIEAAPQSQHLYRNRGVIRLKRGRAEEALSDFQKAAELGADDASFHFAWGYCLRYMLRWSEAAEHYEKAAHNGWTLPDDGLPEALRHSPAAKKGRVLVVGDSVPHGTASADETGAERSLADILAEVFSWSREKIADESVPGSLARQLRFAFPSILEKNSGIATCIIWSGHNDAFCQASEKDIAFDLSSIAMTCRLRGIMPLIVGPVPVESTPARDRVAQENTLKKLNDLVGAFCKSNEVAFVNVRELFAGTDVRTILDLETGNHLKLDALKKVASSVASKLQELQ